MGQCDPMPDQFGRRAFGTSVIITRPCSFGTLAKSATGSRHALVLHLLLFLPVSFPASLSFLCFWETQCLLPRMASECPRIPVFPIQCPFPIPRRFAAVAFNSLSTSILRLCAAFSSSCTNTLPDRVLSCRWRSLSSFLAVRSPAFYHTVSVCLTPTLSLWWMPIKRLLCLPCSVPRVCCLPFGLVRESRGLPLWLDVDGSVPLAFCRGPLFASRPWKVELA